jgi:F1F0 ATPase subunit 2
MSWIMATGVGAGLGLAYFGGLWLTVSQVVSRPSLALWIPLGSLARLILLGMGLVLLGRQGAGHILAALGGLLLSRWVLLRQLGGIPHGRP